MVYERIPIYDWVGFHPLYTLNNQGFFHCSGVFLVPARIDYFQSVFGRSLGFFGVYPELVGGWTTHLKNMLVKLDHFPQVGVNIKTV